MNRAERRQRTFKKQQSRVNRLRFCHHFKDLTERERGVLKDTARAGLPKWHLEKGSRSIPMPERRKEIVDVNSSDGLEEIRTRARKFITTWLEASPDSAREEMRQVKATLEEFKKHGLVIMTASWSQMQYGFWDILMEYRRQRTPVVIE